MAILEWMEPNFQVASHIGFAGFGYLTLVLIAHHIFAPTPGPKRIGFVTESPEDTELEATIRLLLPYILIIIFCIWLIGGLDFAFGYTGATNLGLCAIGFTAALAGLRLRRRARDELGAAYPRIWPRWPMLTYDVFSLAPIIAISAVQIID